MTSITSEKSSQNVLIMKQLTNPRNSVCYSLTFAANHSNSLKIYKGISTKIAKLNTVVDAVDNTILFFVTSKPNVVILLVKSQIKGKKIR